MKYGLIGEKLGHSFSKEIHEKLADYTYELKELKPEELDGFMKAKAFNAINVTIPYKQAVMPYLDKILPIAKEIGAVNTVINCEGELCGYNTDILGLRALLSHNKIPLYGKKVLILGSGGTSHTARVLVRELGAAEIHIISRSGKDGITYEEAYANHKDAQIVINTTPCGMYPDIDSSPLDLSQFSALEGVIDVVYNPLRTPLVLQAKKRGIPADGGLLMLVAQAVYAVDLFVDSFEEERIIEIYRQILAQKENIVLIGMPGCGKSTVGQSLAKKLGRLFYDTDTLIQERFGKTPAEIINQEGEAAFREKESAVIRDTVTAKTGCIIATGGGAILRDENIENLKKNGKIFFLDRPLELLVTTKDRPLSGNRELLEKRYNERYDRYCEAADVSIAPAIDLDAICNEIIKEMNL